MEGYTCDLFRICSFWPNFQSSSFWHSFETAWCPDHQTTFGLVVWAVLMRIFDCAKKCISMRTRFLELARSYRKTDFMFLFSGLKFIMQSYETGSWKVVQNGPKLRKMKGYTLVIYLKFAHFWPNFNHVVFHLLLIQHDVLITKIHLVWSFEQFCSVFSTAQRNR